MLDLIVTQFLISITFFMVAARIPFFGRPANRPPVRPPDTARPVPRSSRSQSLLALPNRGNNPEPSSEPSQPVQSEITPLENPTAEETSPLRQEERQEDTSNSFQFEEFLATLDPDYHQRGVTTDFLTWLVGFIEGDGSWGRTARGDWFFIITQKIRKALDLIQKRLGFGKVYRKTNGMFEYTLASQSLIHRMLLLLNGNLILEKRRTRFTQTVQLWNRHVTVYPLEQKPWLAEIGLDNAWISGFFDAESSFLVSDSPPPVYLSERVEVTQGEPNALERIRQLFEVQGKLLFDSKRSLYKVAIRSKANQKIFIDYLTRFRPVVKASEFRWWKLLYYVRTKKPLTERVKRIRSKIIELFKRAKTED